MCYGGFFFLLGALRVAYMVLTWCLAGRAVLLAPGWSTTHHPRLPHPHTHNEDNEVGGGLVPGAVPGKGWWAPGEGGREHKDDGGCHVVSLSRVLLLVIDPFAWSSNVSVVLSITYYVVVLFLSLEMHIR